MGSSTHPVDWEPGVWVARVRQLWTPTLGARARLSLENPGLRLYVSTSALRGENRKSCRSHRAFPFASPPGPEVQDGGRIPGSWSRPELPLPSSKPAALSPPLLPPPPRGFWFSPHLPAEGPCSCAGGEREDQVSGTPPPFSDLTSSLPPEPPLLLSG